MKRLIITISFVYLSILGFSQSYINPITFEQTTGILPEETDSLVLEKILGDSRFVIPHSICHAIYTEDGQYIIVCGNSYVACFDQVSGERIWQQFLDKENNKPTYYPIRTAATHVVTNQLVVGSDNGKVWLIDLSTGRIKKVLADRMNWLMSVTFSPNGRYVAMVDIKGKYKMYDLIKDRKVSLPKIINQRGEVVQFSDDGKYLAIGFKESFWIIDWKAFKAKKYKAPSTVQSLVFINGNKEVLISGWTGFIQRVHLKTEEIIWEDKVEHWLTHLQVLPDKISVLGITAEYVLHIDLENYKIKETDLSVREAMDLHPNGKTILTIKDNTNRVEQYDWKTEKSVNNSIYYAEYPRKLAFSPNGKYFAAGPKYIADKAIFWNTENWEIVGTIETDNCKGFKNFEFINNGNHFYALSNCDFEKMRKRKHHHYYNVPSFKPLRLGQFIEFKRKPFHHVSTSLEANGATHLKSQLPVKTSSYTDKLEDVLNPYLFGGFTIETAYFAGVTYENMLYVYNMKTGEKVAGTPLSNFSVVACVIHPEAKLVAVTSWDGLIYLYRWK